jgi:8-oxo-dGDP phosphatase
VSGRGEATGADAGNGFERLGEREIFRGHLIGVANARFSAPDGQQFERDIVHHPGAVAIVALEQPDVVTLVRQFRPALGHSVLELPAGTRDVSGEPPQETARRELAEEVGLYASEMEHLATIYNSPGYSDQVTLVFLAVGLSRGELGRSGVEERWMKTERVALSEVSQLVAGGRLADATTIIGLLLTAERARSA